GRRPRQPLCRGTLCAWGILVWSLGFLLGGNGWYHVIIRIRRFSSVRPVVDFAREVRAGTGVDVRRDVERLLRGEPLGAIDRHQRVDERGGSVDPRHPGAHVVGALSPE